MATMYIKKQQGWLCYDLDRLIIYYLHRICLYMWPRDGPAYYMFNIFICYEKCFTIFLIAHILCMYSVLCTLTHTNNWINNILNIIVIYTEFILFKCYYIIIILLKINISILHKYLL